MKKATLCFALLCYLFVLEIEAQVYLSEGFETAVPPAGWVDQAGANDSGNLWVQSSTRANTGSNSAFFDDFSGDNDRYLISPAMDLSGATSPQLIYYENINFTTFAETHEVLYSTDYAGDPQTATWTLLNSNIGSEDVWQELGPYPLPAQANVYVAFRYAGNFDAEWYIDDVLVREAPTCTEPTYTSTIVEDCSNSQFSVDLDFTDLGDSTTLTITNSYDANTVNVTSTGVITLGPYPSGTNVDVSIAHENDTDCDTTPDTFSFVCPPVNDNFVDAEAVVCGGNYTGNTFFATIDEDDAPDGGGADADAPNVWYRYDSATEGAFDVTIDLCASLYDSSVLVYTGTSGNLSFVAGNDDSTVCGNNRSYLTFTADGVQTYYIMVEGWNSGSIGTYNMSVTCTPITPPPANDECVNAIPLTLTVTESGTTVGATQNGSEDQPSCDFFGSINDVWYSIDAQSDGELSIITTITGTSDQANVAVYSACGGAAADELACSDANGGENVTVTVIAGTYYIRVWSDGAAPPSTSRTEGTFDIVVDLTLSDKEFDFESGFSYYPNPANDTLHLSAQSQIQSVSLYNILGQRIFKLQPNSLESQLNISTLQKGTYLMEVRVNNTKKTIKIVKS